MPTAMVVMAMMILVMIVVVFGLGQPRPFVVPRHHRPLLGLGHHRPFRGPMVVLVTWGGHSARCSQGAETSEGDGGEKQFAH